MAVKGRTKVVRPRSKGQITIPVEFRKALHIDEETLLSVSLVGGKLELVPIRLGEAEPLRDYADEDLQRFLEEDRIDAETAARVRKLLSQGRL
jgi:AbrB family looped-hinge helix DNA binding protein